jgi:hypothetical protein
VNENKWVPLIQGQEPKGVVLVHRTRADGLLAPRGPVLVAYFVGNKWKMQAAGPVSGKVTHWMKLPEVPKEMAKPSTFDVTKCQKCGRKKHVCRCREANQ